MTLFIAFLLFIVALGKAFDYFLLKNDKTKIYKDFIQFDKIIDNTKTPDLHNLIINKTLFFFKTHFNFKKRPIRSILITIIISWSATTLINIPYYFLSINHSISRIVKWHDYLPWYPVYLINLVFDFLTIIITLKIIKLIKGKNLWIAIKLIAVDITIAYFLVYLCYTSASYFNSYLFLNTDFLTEYHSKSNFETRKIKNFDFSYLKDRGYTIDTSGFSENVKVKILPNRNPFSKSEFRYFNIMLYYYSIPIDVKWPNVNETFSIIISDNQKEKKIQVKLDNNKVGIEHDLFIYSLTSFIPTLTFIALLLLLIIYKHLFNIFKSISSRYLKVNIESVNQNEIEKFKPGIHIAITLTVFISFIKLIQEIIELFLL